MLTRQHGAIAVAVVESSTWRWELKVDHRGLFRWYLDGTIETNLLGCTVDLAESALRRFVDNSLRGELKVIYPAERIGVDSESGNSRFKSASVG